MKLPLFLVAAIILFTVALCLGEHPAPTVCLGAPTTVPRPPDATASPMAAEGLTRDILIARLQQRQYAVERAGIAHQPFLRVEGERLRLDAAGRPAADLHTFEYETVALAVDDARRITPEGNAEWIEPDGTGRGMMFAWVSTPHFYRGGRLIVIYVGTDPAIVALLDEQFGSQFAGR